MLVQFSSWSSSFRAQETISLGQQGLRSVTSDTWRASIVVPFSPRLRDVDEVTLRMATYAGPKLQYHCYTLRLNDLVDALPS